jgi:hypothetical protein
MVKGKRTKDTQYHGQRESVFFQLPFGHDIVCLLSVFLWPCYCLSYVSFPLSTILSVFFQLPFGHDIVCLLSVSQDRQYHGQREADKRQTISWPKENGQKTHNIMAKGKLTKTDNNMVSFPLAMLVSVFCQIPFVHDIVCLFSFPLSIILSVFSQFPFGHDIFWLLAKGKLKKDRNHHGQRETDKRQTITWPKEN